MISEKSVGDLAEEYGFGVSLDYSGDSATVFVTGDIDCNSHLEEFAKDLKMRTGYEFCEAGSTRDGYLVNLSQRSGL